MEGRMGIKMKKLFFRVRIWGISVLKVQDIELRRRKIQDTEVMMKV